MLTNLFSMFDPFNYKFSPFIWMIFFFFFLKSNFKSNWFILNNNFNFFFNTLQGLSKEFSKELSILNNKKSKKYGNKKMFFSLLLFIFFVNFTSLFPFIMSITSHMSLNLPLASSLWLSSVLVALKISWTNFFSHLTPLGTPSALMSFMVLIETVSTIIRPLTLAVRLMANMVAGHLLLTLLSNFNMMSQFTFHSTASVMYILTLLEMMVTFIQAYVFTLLTILYFKEAF